MRAVVALTSAAGAMVIDLRLGYLRGAFKVYEAVLGAVSGG